LIKVVDQLSRKLAMKTFLDFVLTRLWANSPLPNLPLLFLISLGALFAPTELSATGSFRFEETGSLSTARKFHTATLLPDGKVLVAGGNALGVQGLVSTELYDPAAGVWTASGDMLIGRGIHTATLLSSGKMLVAGGLRDSDHSIKRTELYDPARGTWTETGSMMTSRYEHTATLLADGRVLVAGGYIEDNGFSVTASAELYDPATGVWTATADLPLKAGGHTATLLPDGSVLVAGGSNLDLGVLTSAELYNPATGLWTSTGSLTTARAGHSATLLENGMVLVAGGSTGFSGPDEYIMTAELYDPATGIWTETGDLNHGRFAHTVTLLPNGKVLVTAGAGRGNFLQPIASIEIYDPASGIWSTFGRLVTARQFHTATLLPSGDVLVAGGEDTLHVALASAERGTR
jgi:hypothetical protein